MKTETHFKAIDDLITRLRNKPLRTTLFIFIIIIFFGAIVFIKSYISEMGRQNAMSTFSDNSKQNNIDLKNSTKLKNIKSEKDTSIKEKMEKNKSKYYVDNNVYDEEVNITFLKNPDEYNKRKKENLQKIAQIYKDSIIINNNEIFKYLINDTSVTKRYNKREFSDTFIDSSEYINIKIVSDRFGSKINYRIPYDIKVWAFEDCIVETLGLPQEIEVEELGISFEFIYNLVNEDILNRNKTLREIGIKNNEELELGIDVTMLDKNTKDMDEELKNLMYFKFYGKEIHKYIFELGKRIDNAKDSLRSKYILDIFNNSWFSYLE